MTWKVVLHWPERPDPFVCDWCGRRFTWAHDLVRHVIEHRSAEQ